MSQQKGAKGGLGRTPPKPAPYWARNMPWAAIIREERALLKEKESLQGVEGLGK